MPTPYSEDLRLHVVNAVENGKVTREVATLFQVTSSFVSAIHQCWKQKDHVHPKQAGVTTDEPFWNRMKTSSRPSYPIIRR